MKSSGMGIWVMEEMLLKAAHHLYNEIHFVRKTVVCGRVKGHWVHALPEAPQTHKGNLVTCAQAWQCKEEQRLRALFSDWWRKMQWLPDQGQWQSRSALSMPCSQNPLQLGTPHIFWSEKDWVLISKHHKFQTLS